MYTYNLAGVQPFSNGFCIFLEIFYIMSLFSVVSNKWHILFK